LKLSARSTNLFGEVEIRKPFSGLGPHTYVADPDEHS